MNLKIRIIRLDSELNWKIGDVISNGVITRLEQSGEKSFQGYAQNGNENEFLAFSVVDGLVIYYEDGSLQTSRIVDEMQNRIGGK